jgi:hypothetical protein
MVYKAATEFDAAFDVVLWRRQISLLLAVFTPPTG